jgi:hypothetical protein
MKEFILTNLENFGIFVAGIVVAVLVIRFKKEIGRLVDFIIDSLLSLARLRFFMLKRYKRSIIRSYRETKVGYRNLRLDLDRNYISLKVRQFVSPKQRDSEESSKDNKLDALEAMKEKELRHLVILGAPGAGKTTLMQWLLLKYAYGQMKDLLEETLIPVFITLRSLDSGQSVDELLVEVLNNHHFKGGVDYFRRLMEKGKCLLIFDGMDEICDSKTRKRFIDDINGKYGKLYGQCRILVTSRSEDYPNDPFLPSFRELEIQDLDLEQVTSFVHGILNDEEKPENLLKQIEKREGLKKFVTNPLMLSLLTFVYRESRKKLPNDRVKVYEHCMQLMLRDRDDSKGIYEYRNIYDPDDKELLLCRLAYDLALQNKWRFTEAELLEHWERHLPSNLEKSDLKKLVKEVCEANGLLKHISGKELAFFHRTFQEYYAAREIKERGRDYFGKEENADICKQFCNKEWHEITLFLVGLLDDAGDLIRDILPREPQLAFNCLIYSKRVEDEVIKEVTCAELSKVNENTIPYLSDNMVYLAHRYGLERTCGYFSNALNCIKKHEENVLLWQVIDSVMMQFSPQKKMVYVASGVIGWRREKGKWVPGFWMDMYPVTNHYYKQFTEANDVKNLPRYWSVKQNEEPMVTNRMKLLPIVDINLGGSIRYSSYFNKRLPCSCEWTRARGDENPLVGDEFSKGRKLNTFLQYKLSYYFGDYIILKRAIERALELSYPTDFDRDIKHILSVARELVSALDRNFSRRMALDFYRERDSESKLRLENAQKLVKIIDCALKLNRSIAPNYAIDIISIFSSCSWPKSINESVEISSQVAGKIKKELTKKSIEGVSALMLMFGNTLVDVLISFSKVIHGASPIPDELLMSLRQSGLLTDVNKFSPNISGLYDLIGNVWEWTSTQNEKGQHLICGGAWTEDTYEPGKEVWVVPERRDINLGFRCACDWDKIGQVKEIGDIS